MKYTKLGNTGLTVSRICLGCMSYGEAGDGSSSLKHAWTLDEDTSRGFFRRALEAGINFFDTANGYSEGSSEEFLGRAMQALARRDEVVIATKAFLPWRESPNTGGLSRKALFQAIDDSLRRLGMDYVDLYQIHRWDYETPIEETMEALHDIVKAGKARYIGASSMRAWEFFKAQSTAERHGWTKFVAMQNHLNLLYREEEREMMPLCEDLGVGVIPWSPLARGRLARPWDTHTERSQSDRFGKRIYAATEDNDREIVERVGAVAGERGVSRAQVALAWLLGTPAVAAPIIGASKLAHLEDAIAAVDVELSDAEREQLEAPYRPHPVVGLAGPLPPPKSVSVLD
ncbi:aldo/keto reductase [Haliangium ochraceum]|uniref:Aldo/keto reductase n=1 Tax=Haliangium ochraceum (strain DSM 14365 / JCM 11303 / SMP-2) TaxID=502025 RepID=D0LS89_HALO1|nr:aldo/keto reductase [Haliangium ochraceum]ACY15588.1 aldo/keto reductase [Haliangium ochraceum DSM 14365]